MVLAPAMLSELGRPYPRCSALLPVVIMVGCGIPTQRTTERVEAVRLSALSEQLLAGPEESEFGASIAIADGIALVGAPSARVSGSVSGAVYAFRRDGSAWAGATRLDPPDPTEGQRFGEVLAFTGDRAAVGNPFAAVPAVWVVPRAGQDWGVPEAVLPAPNGASAFGWVLAMDATTLLVGAPLVEEGPGAVYVYERDDSAAWSGPETLTPTGNDPGPVYFGFSLALSGNRAIVGAVGDDGGAGAAYVFERSGIGEAWEQTARLPAPDSITISFGSAVASSGDVLAVAAPSANGERGVVQTYQRDGIEWTPGARLEPGGDGVADSFGTCLAFSADALYVSATGAMGQSYASGRVDAFGLDGTWTSVTSLAPEEEVGVLSFGRLLAVSDADTVLVASATSVYSYLPSLGAECSRDFECASGHCSEGVCCEEACVEACYSCLGSRKNGGDGTSGTCEPVDGHTDPRGDCEASDEVCGSTGYCDGNGACALASADTSCSEGACATERASVGGGHCDGEGGCAIPESEPCLEGYACVGSACQGSCTDDRQCDTAGAYYCYEGGCVSGARCSLDRAVAIDPEGNRTECSKELCEAGVCLTACRGTFDCAGGLVCDPYAHRCVPETNLASQQQAAAAGCRLATGGVTARSGALWLLVGLLAARRVRPQSAKRLARTGRAVARGG
jgi:hypothetical protein